MVSLAFQLASAQTPGQSASTRLATLSRRSTDHSTLSVRSAAAAGLSVVGMSTSLDAEALKGAGAHIVARDFTDPGLISLVRERTGMA